MDYDEEQIRQIKLTHSREEILNALQIIKDTCNKYHNCDMCPLGTSTDSCIIQTDCPEDWPIKSNEEIWRAFD